MTRTSQTNARDTGTGATATPATGVQFPADAAGNRSTGQLAKHVVAEALRTVDPAAADRVYRIKDWRKGYIAPFTELVSVGVTDSDAWGEVARTALEELQTRMVGVHTVDGETVETPINGYIASVPDRIRLRSTASHAWDEVPRTSLEERQPRMGGLHTVHGERRETPMTH